MSKETPRVLNRDELGKEIINRLGNARESELTPKERKLVQNTLSELLNISTEVLQEGGKVKLTGFGTLQVIQRKARVGVNPQNRERIEIPATKTVRFSAGKTLKDKIVNS